MAAAPPLSKQRGLQNCFWFSFRRNHQKKYGWVVLYGRFLGGWLAWSYSPDRLWMKGCSSSREGFANHNSTWFNGLRVYKVGATICGTLSFSFTFLHWNLFCFILFYESGYLLRRRAEEGWDLSGRGSCRGAVCVCVLHHDKDPIQKNQQSQDFGWEMQVRFAP